MLENNPYHGFWFHEVHLLREGGETMEFKSIDQMDIAGKKVFLRVDFNVPIDKSGKVTDESSSASR